MSELDQKADSEVSSNLPRTLGLRDLILLTIGSVIGSGIFLVPGAVLRQVNGFIIPALLVWVIGGVLSLLGALTYGELAALKPATGGLYVYIRDCFGRFPAFLFGWTLFFVISSGAVATLAVAFSAYLGDRATDTAFGEMYCGLNDYSRDRGQRSWHAKEFRSAKLDDGCESDCHSFDEHRSALAWSRLSRGQSDTLANLLQHIAGLRVRSGDDQCALGL
jgi:hypothetical protein